MILYHIYTLRCPELIETLWNVNAFANVAWQYTSSELIETLWNVNHASRSVRKADALCELIETLWNVNHSSWNTATAVSVELIETLWNVNLTIINKGVCLPRINRNIVECKFSL